MSAEWMEDQLKSYLISALARIEFAELQADGDDEATHDLLALLDEHTALTSRVEHLENRLRLEAEVDKLKRRLAYDHNAKENSTAKPRSENMVIKSPVRLGQVSLAWIEQQVDSYVHAAFGWKARAEKAEAEVDELATKASHLQHDLLCEERDRKEAEAELKLAEGTIEEITKAWCLDKAELDAARPLIEAVMEVEWEKVASLSAFFLSYDSGTMMDMSAILRAALALREKKGA